MFNQLVAKTLPIVPRPIVKAVAKRYIAGESLEEAVGVIAGLNALGARATVDVLGEFVNSRLRAEKETAMCADTLDAIHANGLQSGVSVKLTSLGLDIDEDFCYRNVRSLIEKARDYKLFVRLDMDNSPYTDKTLALYRRLRGEGLDNIGVVIQAYLKRSEKDIRELASLRASVRLCKGIYNEAASIAYKEPEQIRANYRTLLNLLFDNGMYAGIATHDDALLEYAQETIQKRDMPAGTYEFQMLLGVREDRRDALLSAGHKVRVYVPFGDDWYGYSVRRLKENPAIAGHVFKAMFRRR